MEQGERFIAAGDVVTARIAFQRTAEAGDADAALALGGTYERSWAHRTQDSGSRFLQIASSL